MKLKAFLFVAAATLFVGAAVSRAAPASDAGPPVKYEAKKAELKASIETPGYEVAIMIGGDPLVYESQNDSPENVVRSEDPCNVVHPVTRLQHRWCGEKDNLNSKKEIETDNYTDLSPVPDPDIVKRE